MPLANHLPTAQCHRCDHEDGGTCTVTSLSISQHAATGKCPFDKFGKPLGTRSPGGIFGRLIAEAKELLPSPQVGEGSGVVIPILPGHIEDALVLAELSRERGESVELWHWGKWWTWMDEAAQGFVVRHMGDEMKRSPALLDPSIPEHLKAYALSHTRFSEVTWLDPVTKKETRFYRQYCGRELQLALLQAEYRRAVEFPKSEEKEPWPDFEALAEPIRQRLRAIKSKHVFVVRLESNGDVLVLLPAMKYLARDRQVTFVTFRRYAPLVRNIPWLKVIAIDEPNTRQQVVKDLAEAGDVRDANPIVAGGLYHPWDKSCWKESGLAVELFDSLSLQIENRNYRAERKLLRLHRKHPHRPLILLNLMAFTSPFPQGDRLRYLLMSWYGRDFEIIDLAFVRAKRLTDLMGLYEKACLLISCDTGTLHLGYATRTPTVALVSDGQGPRSPGASSPRSHWICRLRYGKAVTDSGAKMIRQRIDALFHLPPRQEDARAGALAKMTGSNHADAPTRP